MSRKELDMQKHSYILLCSEYDGSIYGGWQRQGKQGNELCMPLPSVQEEIERAAALCLKVQQVVCVQVAGRTDKGVHALNQWCALRVSTISDLEYFRQKINHLLVDKRIAIKSAKHCSNKKFQAVRKRYKYIVQIPKNLYDKRPIQSLQPYSRHESRSLNIDLLQKALDLMVGTHDFQHFSKKKKGVGQTVRTIYKASAVATSKIDELPHFQILNDPSLCWSLTCHDFWIITFEGNGFLWHQVRRMVSLALNVSHGRLPAESVNEVMKGHRDCPVSAPARGLYLDRVWLNENN
mmetsp:Transcript_32794/g.49435  ORF Transcript_32794/g.49435 Transcript_32794/m.49435 type:complete len:293 (+) Transcript_32794:39-917(+)